MVASPRPELKEFAPPPGGAWSDFYGAARLSERILRSEGFSGHSSSYSLFEEMEDKDPHLASTLQTRKMGVLARTARVEAAGDSERDVQIARWLEGTLAAIPGWNQALLHLLDAIAKGMSVLEILWEFDAAGALVPRALKPRGAERFGWRREGGWRLLDPGERAMAGGRALPENKFIIALNGASDERPYGKGLCERVYWYWWFKKHNIKFWLIYNDEKVKLYFRISYRIKPMLLLRAVIRTLQRLCLLCLKLRQIHSIWLSIKHILAALQG